MSALVTAVALTAVSAGLQIYGANKAAKGAERQADAQAAVEEKLTAERVRQLDIDERVQYGETLAGYAGGGVLAQTPGLDPAKFRTGQQGSPLVVLQEAAREFAKEREVTQDVGAANIAQIQLGGKATATRYKWQGYAGAADTLASDQQSKIVPPGQIAAAEAAPFMAFSDALESAGDTVLAIKQARDKATDADDASKVQLWKQKADNQFQINAKQAEAEKWDAERLREADAQVIREFLSKAGDVSERNRDKFAEVMGLQAENWAELSALEANILSSKRSVERLTEARKLAMAAGNWTEAESITEMGVEIGAWTAEQAEIDRIEISDRRIAKELGEQYAQAAVEGKQEAFMDKVGKMDLSDNAISYFTAEKQRVDLFSDQAEQQAMIDFELGYQKFLYSITPSTPIELIDQFAQENANRLSRDHISRMYSAKNAQDESEATLGGVFTDSNIKSNRKKVNAAAVVRDENGQLDEAATVNRAIDISAQYRISPELLSPWFENTVQINEPEFVGKAGEAYIKYMESAEGVPLPLNDFAQAKLEFYRDMRQKFGADPVYATTATVAEFADVNDAKMSARRQAFDNPKSGSDGKKAPSELIMAGVKDALIDTDSVFVKQFLRERSWFIPNKDYENVPIPPEMEAEINGIAQRMYEITGAEQPTINSVIRMLHSNGWAITDANKDVEWMDDKEYGFQFQKRPITEIGTHTVGPEAARTMLEKDFVQYEEKYGSRKLTVDQGLGAARGFSVSELAFGEGYTDTDKKSDTYGKTLWPVLYRGSPVRWTAGPQQGMPVVFYYPDEYEAKFQDKNAQEKKEKLLGPAIQERRSTGMEGTTIDLPGIGTG
jgi:hypothetical protein